MRPSLSLPLSIFLYLSLLSSLSLAHSPNRIRQVTQAAAPTPVAGAPAPARTSWEQAAEIVGAAAECSPYYYEPVGSIVNTFPAIWQTANLQGSGIPAADIAFFNSISPSIPKIAPKGTRAGNFTGVVYEAADPDCWWSWSTCTHPKIAGIPADTVRCEEPQSYGFTLDDGPNCSHNAYYDYLQSKNQKATLFYIGSNVLDWPLEAQRGLGDGHEICAHTWSHPYMTAMTNEEAFAELYYSKKAILDVLGINVGCWRPPYGDVDDRIRWIAQRLGMITMLWSADTSDWKVATVGVPAVQANYANIIAQGKNGTYATQGVMVLSHELNNETMVLNEQFLPQIQSTFTGGVMPMAVCMNNTQPYGGTNGAQYIYPNYEQWQSGTRSIMLAQPTAASRVLNIVPASESGIGMTTTTSAVNIPGAATPVAIVTVTGSVTPLADTTPTTTSSSSSKSNSSSSIGSNAIVVSIGSVSSMILMGFWMI